MTPYETTTFKHHGRTFRCEIFPDEPHDPPWENDCGRGIVVQRHSYTCSWLDKRSYERILWSDRGDYLLLDMRATRKKALVDGWGLSPEELSKLRASVNAKGSVERASVNAKGSVERASVNAKGSVEREPTKRQIAARAVELEFRFLRDYLNGDWCYVGVVVTDLESKESSSLWGIESNEREYLTTVRDELANELHPLADTEESCVLGES